MIFFSEYVAILSGNTDLLEKAKLEKKIAGLDSERQAFIRSKSSSKDLFDLSQNKFFVTGESGMKYSYNNGRIAADPQLACMNFLNALEKIHGLIEKFKADTEKIAKEIPVLQEVVNGSWKKEEQLKDLKTQLAALDRKIQLKPTFF